MPRRLNRRQRRENAAFLAELALTGNVRLACRALGLNRSTFTRRRSKHPDFAARWDRTLAAAHARLERQGGARPPEILPETGRGTTRRVVEGAPPRHGLRTRGGEPTVVRLKSGRLQLREALPGRMTEAAHDAFLDRLAETANQRLAAAAAGFAAPSFVYRRRADPEFAGTVERAIAEAGPYILEQDRLASAALREEERRAWEADPRWPEGLTVDQALMAMGLPAFLLPGRRRR